MVRLEGRDISGQNEGVYPILEGELEKMEMEGDKDEVVEEGVERGEEQIGDRGEEQIGGRGRKRRIRQVLNWGTVKYKEHRYKYDPCKLSATNWLCH